MDLQNEKYLISIGENGIFMTKTDGNGDEKDRDIEFTWGEAH